MSVSTLANLTALTHGAEPVLPIAYTAQSRPRAAGVSHWDSSTASAKAGVSHWDKAAA